MKSKNPTPVIRSGLGGVDINTGVHVGAGEAEHKKVTHVVVVAVRNENVEDPLLFFECEAHGERAGVEGNVIVHEKASESCGAAREVVCSYHPEFHRRPPCYWRLFQEFTLSGRTEVARRRLKLVPVQS